MVLYLFIQTIILLIGAGLMAYGGYQTNEYLVKRRHDLYINIG